MLFGLDDSPFNSAGLPSHHVHHKDPLCWVKVKEPSHIEFTSTIHTLHIKRVNELESKVIDFDFLVDFQITVENDSLTLPDRVSRIVLTRTIIQVEFE